MRCSIQATRIEAEVEYLPRRLQEVVERDNEGINLRKHGTGRRALGFLRMLIERSRSETHDLSRPDARKAAVEISVSGEAFARCLRF